MRRHASVLGWAALALVMRMLPLAIADYWRFLISQGFIQSLVVLSIIVTYRATGSLSLCQVSFSGMGAYAMAWMATRFGFGLLPSLVIGALAIVPVGMLLALPAVRLRGIEFTILTLMVGLAANGLVFSTSAPLSPSQGQATVPSGVLLGLNLANSTDTYYLTLIVAGGRHRPSRLAAGQPAGPDLAGDEERPGRR